MFFNRGSVQNEPDVTTVITNQLSLKERLNKWGEKGRGEVHSYTKHLHIRDTLIPLHRKELTEEQRNTILDSQISLKDKREGTLKIRTAVGGNNQKDFISKEYASSPTVFTTSVLLTFIIEEEEHRDVGTVGILNAFIQTRIKYEKDMSIIKISGVLVDILLEITPDVYAPYDITD